MTLRTRITLLTLTLLAASLLFMGLAVYSLLARYLYQGLKNELDDALGQVVRLVNRGGKSLLEAALPPTVYAEVDLVLALPPLKAQDLEQAIPLVRSPALGGQRLRLAEADYALLLRQRIIWTRAELPRGQAAPLPLLVRASLLEAQGPPPLERIPVLVLVAKSTEPIEATLDQLVRIYAATALFVLLIGGWLAYLLVARTLKPLEAIARQAEAISARSFAPLPEPEGSDEVATLARALNRMLARLEHAFEAQRRFLADASHELRTPITAILGHVGYLKRRTNPSERQLESLEVIAREGERMRKLVGDLLELAESESGWRFEPRPVELGQVLGEVVEEFRPTFAGRLLLEAPDEPVWVLADPDRLHQVFANLVSNAIKAGAKAITLRVRAPRERVIVQVADDGPGIPAEHLPHLFERFYRVDKARDREKGGSGLGLAIVKAIVEASGGEVWVESEPGRGTTFSVALARAEPPPEAQEPGD